MKRLKLTLLLPVALAAYGQTKEFEAASIHINPPREGFHLASDSSSGGPGTADPSTYRCTNCTLATLITKAFDLQDYQLPGKASMGTGTVNVVAKLPVGATQDEFQAMLQNLLKERFSLTYHFKDKSLRGYHLVVAKNGAKLKESGDAARPPAGDWRGSESHTHNGVIAFGGSARFRADHQTTADLARLLSSQLSLPVDDETGLTGKYDISLSWSGTGAQSGGHTDGAWSGGAGHGDHGGDAAGGPSAASDPPGLTLFDALQTQLGLKLVASEQTVARMFVVDHVEQQPTAN